MARPERAGVDGAAIRRGWVPYALCASTFFFYWLAMPGVDFWPVIFFAFVPMLIALRDQPPRRALYIGLFGGFLGVMSGFYWLLGMLQQFSGFPIVVCALFMAILCAYQGGRFGLWAWLSARARQRGWPQHTVFLLGFIASELVYPLLFPWYLAVTLHKVAPLIQTADIGGPIAIGVVILCTNLGLTEIVAARLDKRTVDRKRVWTLAALPLALLYGFVRVRSVDRAAQASEALNVGITQGNIPLMGGHGGSLETQLRLTNTLKQQGVGLAVWSESGVVRTFLENDYKRTIPREIGPRLGVPTLMGVTIKRPEGRIDDQGRAHATWFNVAVMTDAHGEVLGRYDKQKLLAFGEYLPFGDTFPVLYDWSPNSGKFQPGTSLDPIVWGDHRITTLICYEDILPSLVDRMVSHADPDLLVNMTNDAWFGDTTEPWIHLALAKFRSVEHHRYLVRSTNSGVSAIVDPVGRLIAHGATFKEDVVVGTVHFMKMHTLYEWIGDTPWWLATVAIGLMAFVSREKASAIVRRRRS